MTLTSSLVLAILRNWRSYEWTCQGFGFVRTKLENVGRIHVWDSTLTTPKVSTIHTHPWPLWSTIISGELVNVRFTETDDIHANPFMRSKIATGEGGGLIGEPELVRLTRIKERAIDGPEFYGPGDHYVQAAAEIHRSMPQDGTVTLIERPMGPPLEEALVYWPAGTNWVSAEPRPIDKNDWRIAGVFEYALARWAPA